MEIRFNDLVSEHIERWHGYHEALRETLESGQFILGSAVDDFERQISSRLGFQNFVAVGSGTDALYIALKALLHKESDASRKKFVITTPMSYISSTSSIHLAGLKPLFADVDQAMNICPTAVEAILKSREDVLGILVVHLGGIPAQMRSFLKIARKYSVPIIEDCAQAFGTIYEGKPVGSFGDYGAFSFHPLKVFGALGDAGGLAIANEEDAIYASKARNHGHITRDNVEFFSHNMRMDALQAAFLRHSLDTIKIRLETRRNQVDYFVLKLKCLIESGLVSLPIAPSGAEYIAYNFFMIRAKHRDKLMDHLQKKGIETKIHYPRLLTSLDSNKNLPIQEWIEIPNAQASVREILSLPIGSHINNGVIEKICFALEEFYGVS